MSQTCHVFTKQPYIKKSSSELITTKYEGDITPVVLLQGVDVSSSSSDYQILPGAINRHIFACYNLWKTDYCAITQAGTAGNQWQALAGASVNGIGTVYTFWAISGIVVKSCWTSTSLDNHLVYNGVVNSSGSNVSVTRNYDVYADLADRSSISTQTCYSSEIGDVVGSQYSSFGCTISIYLPERKLTKLEKRFDDLNYNWIDLFYGAGANHPARESLSCGGTWVDKQRFNSAKPLHLGDGKEVVKLRVNNLPTDETPDGKKIYQVLFWSDGSTSFPTPNNNGSDGDKWEDFSEVEYTLKGRDTKITCQIAKAWFNLTVLTNVEGSISVKDSNGNTITNYTNAYFPRKSSGYTALISCGSTPNGYIFEGWYYAKKANASAEECTTSYSSSPVSVQYTASDRDNAGNISNDITLYAKWSIKKSSIDVSVNDKTLGLFNLSGGVTGANLDKYTAEGISTDATIYATAVPNENAKFSYWEYEAPDGSGKKTTSEKTVQLQLIKDNALSVYKAYFATKDKKRVTPSVYGYGRLKSSSITGELDGTGNGVTEGSAWEFTEDAEFTLTAEETLMATSVDNGSTEVFSAFKYFEWSSDGKTFSKLTASSKPNWVKSLSSDGKTLTCLIPLNDSATNRYIRPVFECKTLHDVSFVIDGSRKIGEKITSASEDGCSIAVSTASKKFKNPLDESKEGWFDGVEYKLAISKKPEWNLSSLYFQNTEEEINPSDTLTFSQEDGDLVIVGYFDIKKVTIRAVVDSASRAVGGAGINYERSDGSSEKNVPEVEVDYGDTFTLSASSSYNDSVKFFDWVKNGNSVSSEQDVEFTATEAVEYVARFSVLQTFSVDDGRKGIGKATLSYTSDGMSNSVEIRHDKSFSRYFLCGSVFSIAAESLNVEGVSGNFLGWYTSATGSSDSWVVNPNWSKVEEVSATNPLHIQAKFDSVDMWPILRLRNGDKEIAKFVVDGVREERKQILADGSSIVLTNANDYFCFQDKTVHVFFDKNAGFSDETFSKWVQVSISNNEQGEETYTIVGDYSSSPSISVNVYSDIALMPIFKTNERVRIDAKLKDGDDASSGFVMIEGNLLESGRDPVNGSAWAEVYKGDTVELVAVANVGYQFYGWSSKSKWEDVQDFNINSRMPIVLDKKTTYYAFFYKDEDSIRTFDSGSDAKRMTWHSKRVMVNTPISFSVAQVDAEGYGEEGPKLSIFKASSPDVPAKVRTYTIKDGNSRRLAVDGRGEKCFEFVVESSVPVNRVAISTSVTGLMGGA